MRIITSTFCSDNNKARKGSTFVCADEVVAQIAQDQWSRRRQGYRQGVWLVPVDSTDLYHFRCGEVVLHEGDALEGRFESRRAGEAPRKIVVARVAPSRRPVPAAVDLVVYEEEVLREDPLHEPTACGGQVIAVLARYADAESPMTPETLMANHFGTSGGTDTRMTPEQFEAALRASYEYWQGRAVCG